MPLVVEIAGAGGWREMGRIEAGATPGSLSHNTEQGREVITFACHGDHSTIERSTGGVDVELGAGRKVTSVGFEGIARLGPGEKIDLWLRPDTMRTAGRFRFRHEADPPPG